VGVRIYNWNWNWNWNWREREKVDGRNGTPSTSNCWRSFQRLQRQTRRVDQSSHYWSVSSCFFLATFIILFLLFFLL